MFKQLLSRCEIFPIQRSMSSLPIRKLNTVSHFTQDSSSSCQILSEIFSLKHVIDIIGKVLLACVVCTEAGTKCNSDCPLKVTKNTISYIQESLEKLTYYRRTWRSYPCEETVFNNGVLILKVSRYRAGKLSRLL